MAITLTSLSEEILSRPERAVVRGIYRASQLNEALIQFQKCTAPATSDGNRSLRLTALIGTDTLHKMEEYLLQQIAYALKNTKIPLTSGVEQTQPKGEQ